MTCEWWIYIYIYIYILVIWYENDMKYVMVRDMWSIAMFMIWYIVMWYVMFRLFCDTIEVMLYESHIMKWYVKSMKRYVMSPTLTWLKACYEWHDITINDMKYNPVRIMHGMRTEK